RAPGQALANWLVKALTCGLAQRQQAHGGSSILLPRKNGVTIHNTVSLLIVEKPPFALFALQRMDRVRATARGRQRLLDLECARKSRQSINGVNLIAEISQPAVKIPLIPTRRTHLAEKSAVALILEQQVIGVHGEVG